MHFVVRKVLPLRTVEFSLQIHGLIKNKKIAKRHHPLAIGVDQRIRQTALPNHNDFIAANKNIFTCLGLFDEIEIFRDLLTHFRDLRRNSQTIGQKVFLNEALKTEALFHNETALS